MYALGGLHGVLQLCYTVPRRALKTFDAVFVCANELGLFGFECIAL